ncbi:hypothetical protein [Bradyrhizobium sp. JYMT SZCCT0428]|uniref:hypothetical protein n=1 Tax=Bradyrhizobium sp. JYMT SZCCT0428 TaxID=2807673 RepID=UPI001BA4BF46|nr:hypothetical protein [Bradyrhizobium sp. JYMT SZCCT0428]MBR1157272.1 hypothetical protein [Bradyrhizobium sp. JYMT SZCCT0428]
MTQADRVHSTPPTSTTISQNQHAEAPSRRRFLAQAAGVAAGSAVLIGASTIADPAIASHSGPDPILAAIEAHKAAFRAVIAELCAHRAGNRAAAPRSVIPM